MSLASAIGDKVLKIGPELPAAWEPPGNGTAEIAGGKAPERGSYPPVSCAKSSTFTVRRLCAFSGTDPGKASYMLNSEAKKGLLG